MEVSNKEAGEEIDEEEHYDSDSDSHEKNTPLLRPTNKRPRPSAGEKLPAKCATKLRRVSSSLSLGERSEETGVESDISSYALTKPRRVICPRPGPPNPTGLERDISDRSTMDFTGGRSDPRSTSRLAIVYEQQSWRGEIIKERNAKQGRGRPRKQYLIRWKQS
ncbi:hypothetical protein MMC28_009963 [Mycoblastus sanguinarius]|nr:hypothetical protein [Mycoblastus sanguinarius]